MTMGEILGHLTFAALLFLALPRNDWRRAVRAAVLVVCVGLAFVTIGGLSLGDFVRSYTDDLAITTLLWLLWSVGVRISGYRDVLAVQHRRELLWVCALLALLLYPATLGLSRSDPYRLGFAPMLLIAAIWQLCLWLWWRRNFLAVALFAGATLAWILDVKDSHNYWDYIIDPVLGVYCWGCLIAGGWRRAQSRRGRTVSAVE